VKKLCKKPRKGKKKGEESRWSLCFLLQEYSWEKKGKGRGEFETRVPKKKWDKFSLLVIPGVGGGGGEREGDMLLGKRGKKE